MILAAWDSWPVFLARFYARETWRGIPGPWPVKVVLIVVCTAIPGWFDEWALLKVAQWNGARKARAQLADVP